MIDSNSESFYLTQFLVSRYHERETRTWKQLKRSAEQTTTVIRGLVERLVEHNERIGDRELGILYQLCQNSSYGLSAEEKQEKVQELDLPPSDVERITSEVDQSVGSVKAAMQESKLHEGSKIGSVEAEQDLHSSFQRITKNYDSKSELVEIADDLVSIDFHSVQSGLISPILHYLAPTVFPVINGRSNQSIDLLFSMNVSLDLSDYLEEREKYLELRDQFDLESHFRDLDHFLHWVQSSDNEWTEVLREGVNRDVWQAQPGYAKYSVPEELWPIWRDRNIISTGWIGEVDETSDGLSGWTANFIKKMSMGDLVIAKGGVGDLLGLGVISKENHEYVGGTSDEIPVNRPDKSKAHENIRQVEWALTRDFNNSINIRDWDMSKRFGNGWIEGYYNFEELRWYLSENHRDEVLSDLRMLESKSLAYALGRDPGERPPGHGNEDNIPAEPDRANEIKRQLEAKNQVVFYGPPGTGKTFEAQRFARWWVYEESDGQSRAEQVQSVTFHPSFSYEDFIEGLTADTTASGDVEYRVEDGILKRIAGRAQHAYDQAVSDSDGDVNDDVGEEAPPYVLIIDEINRGNLAQIFGETITLLEADKRGSLSVQLAHSDEAFSLPPNLYVIGTMNTADRSIALVDAALRRRFRFIDFPPAVDVLHSEYGFENDEDVSETLAVEPAPLDVLRALTIRAWERLNENILASPDLGKGKQVGHSYLFGLESPQAVRDTWRYDVLPLLEEYQFGQFDRIQQELFDGAIKHLIDSETQQLGSFTLQELVDDLSEFVGVEITTDFTAVGATLADDGSWESSTAAEGGSDDSSDYPTYGAVFEQAQEELFARVGERLGAEEMYDVTHEETDRRSLRFHSNREYIPDRVRFIFKPEPEAEGRVTVKLNAKDASKTVVPDVVDAYRERFAESGFEVTGEENFGIVQRTWPLQAGEKRGGKAAVAEFLESPQYEEALTAFVDLVETTDEVCQSAAEETDLLDSGDGM